jgi:hypothetical protein
MVFLPDLPPPSPSTHVEGTSLTQESRACRKDTSPTCVGDDDSGQDCITTASSLFPLPSSLFPLPSSLLTTHYSLLTTHSLLLTMHFFLDFTPIL